VRPAVRPRLISRQGGKVWRTQEFDLPPGRFICSAYFHCEPLGFIKGLRHTTPSLDYRERRQGAIMHKDIRNRYNESILEETMRRFGIEAGHIRLLDGFESFIYEFDRSGDGFILRIGHTLRNSETFVRGEVDWINYLADNGVPAARAVPSARGNLVERIDDQMGGSFLATSFVKAAGRSPWGLNLTPEFYKTYGRLIGRMHKLAKSYDPRDPNGSRPSWDHPRIADGRKNIPASQPVVKQRYGDYMNWRRHLPRDRESFGLIHEDAHMGNMFVDENGQITLFDFDDCNYSWFANDLAIVLFYRITGEENRHELTAEFMPPFLRGYAQENRLDPHWLATIPSFLKVREIDLYGVLLRSYENPYEAESMWVRGFLKDRKDRIEADEPYLSFDFATLAPYLAGE
jgi:amicoumacin kinase